MTTPKLSDREIAEAVVEAYLRPKFSKEEGLKQATERLTELLATERAAAKELVGKLEKILEETRKYGLKQPPNSWYIERDKTLTAISEWKRIYDA